MVNLNGRVARLERAMPPTAQEMIIKALDVVGWPPVDRAALYAPEPDETERLMVEQWAKGMLTPENRQAIYDLWDRLYGRTVWLPILEAARSNP